MKTSTEELAREHGAKLLQNHCEENEIVFYTSELQAFREAVEAESDAERMNQPAVGYVPYYAIQNLVSDGEAVTKIESEKQYADDISIYVHPFPSTEQLQQRVKELEDVLRKVDAAAVECEGDDGELVFSVDSDTIHAVFDLLEPLLANTQGDSK